MERGTFLGVVLAATVAAATPRTVLVAAGDCRDGALLTASQDLRDALAERLGGELVAAELVLDIVRPPAPRSLQDIERQVESARALLYGGHDARGLEVLERALSDLELVSPTAGPWPVTQSALVLQALMFKNLERPKDMLEAFRRILRVAPDFRLDPDAHPPSAIAALEGLKKELARGRRVPLTVRADGGAVASVFVDGLSVGTTPLRLELPPGSYRVALVAGDGVSFPRKVELSREQTLTVDLAFEAALALQPPLCLQGADDGAAVKLGQLAMAGWVVVLRNTATRGNPPYLAGALYDVATGRQERAGAVQPPLLGNLATFLATGKAQHGVARPGAGGLEAAGVEAPSPASPPVAPGAPRPAEATAKSPRGPVPVAKILSGVLLGAGVAAGVSGVVLYASAAPGRSRLAGLTDVSGQLPTAGTSAHREALQLITSLDATRAASFSLVGAGLGAALGGVLGLALFPSAEIAVSATPTAGGAAVSLSGTW